MKRNWIQIAALMLAAVVLAANLQAADTEANAKYATDLWKHVTKESSPYTKWTATKAKVDVGPASAKGDKSFANKTALADEKALGPGSVIVTEHYAGEKDKVKLSGVTVRYRPTKGYDAPNSDWYWAYFLPGGKYIDSSLERNPLAKCGFVTRVEDGRLWVFRTGSAELGDYLKHGELAKHVVQPGVGPMGMTVKAPDAETIQDYLVCRPGFVTKVDDGRLWVFRSGAKELAEFEKSGELVKSVARLSAGPMGMTLKGPDAETLDAYIYAKPNFVTLLDDGRLWVFRPGSKDLADFQKHGELAKHVVRPGIGPDGMTVKAPDNDTINAYIASRDGFRTVIKGDRVWVFRGGTKELADFFKKGEPAYHVTRPSAGPLGMTVKAPDVETMEAYLRGQG
jgi:hypothetical protein